MDEIFALAWAAIAMVVEWFNKTGWIYIVPFGVYLHASTHFRTFVSPSRSESFIERWQEDGVNPEDIDRARQQVICVSLHQLKVILNAIYAVVFTIAILLGLMLWQIVRA